MSTTNIIMLATLLLLLSMLVLLIFAILMLEGRLGRVGQTSTSDSDHDHYSQFFNKMLCNIICGYMFVCIVLAFYFGF